MIARILLAAVAWGASAASLAADVATLPVLSGGYPRAYFFRHSEGLAHNSKISYEAWGACFSRLMGIEGKVLNEELVHLTPRNREFFTRFKTAHPQQLVLLHYNGNARDPRDDDGRFFAGHWIYYNGAKITADVPAQSGETEIAVDHPELFATQVGRYRTSSDDVGLCELDAAGKPDWSRSEQVQLQSIDVKRRTIRVVRGCYGTTPRALAAGKAYAAAHTSEGPWGAKSNLLWYYNYSTRCPRDAQGRTCSDVLVADLARHFLAGGDLAAFDGVEFDVSMHQLHTPGGRRADCDADGRADLGVFEGINTYGLGVIEFYRQLRQRLGPGRLILADGMDPANQRAAGVLNGIESEGWPDLRDWEIRDWSGGMNRHAFWRQFAARPVFNYFNHKFTMPGEKPGTTKQPDLPFSTHRLVFAAAMFSDAAICYAFPPATPRGELFGVWDELWQGTAQRVGWLGQPVGPAVRLALRQPSLLGGSAKEIGAALLRHVETSEAVCTLDAGGLRITAKDPGTAQVRVRLNDIPCQGPDLSIAMVARGAALTGYPAEMPRLLWLGTAAERGQCTLPDLPETGMALRGAAEGPLRPESGAALRWSSHERLGGEARGAYWVHPPYKGGVGYTFWQRAVRVPADGWLCCSTGMSERAPGRSDGVVFRVLVGEKQSGGDVAWTPVLEHQQVESVWKDHRVSLARWAGREVILKFVSDCGPKDNAVTDHSLWGDVVVSAAAARRTRTPQRFMTWLARQDFSSQFYFSEMEGQAVDLELLIEGGQPLWITGFGVYAAADTMYREFEHGVVLANPGPRKATFDLARLLPGRHYRRLEGSPEQDRATNNGAAVGGTVELGPRDGLFLLRE